MIKQFDSVEALIIKGNWMTAKIEDPRREYLVWRDANSEYWNSMPEGEHAILEGRAPIKNGEVALSKQYFEHHPELAMGEILPEDELTVYLHFHNIRDTYIELPKIADAVGYERDEYGNYLLRYPRQQE